jgi:hypothetical protein
MTHSVSATSPTGLGPFRDITPGGIPRRCGEAVWSATVFEGALYLAVLGREIQTVLRLEPSTGKWETLLHRSVSRPGADSGEIGVAAQFAAGRFQEAPALYLRIAAGDEVEHLRSVGGPFEPVPSHFEEVQAALTAASPAAPALPDHLPSSRFSRALNLGSATVVGLDEPVLGCSLGAKEENWKPVLVRGAHRYSENAEILAAASHGDCLFVVLGKSASAPRRKTPGFEVVRVYADGSWDLLIGTPRVSDQGLKVPLACLGPGMDEFEPSRFCFFASGRNGLLLGTYDDLAGFRIWRSVDGTRWVAGEAELVGIDRVRGAESLPLAGGIALILQLDNPQHGLTQSVWIGE